MRLGNLARMIHKLSGYEVLTRLQLIEHLSAKRVGLGVAGDGSAACGELHNGIIVARLVVDGVCCTISGNNDLSDHLSFGIVGELDGVEHSLIGHDFARKDNCRLGRADNSAFLVYISILFLRENVNRTDDIALPIVDIEKLRTSNEVRRKGIALLLYDFFFKDNFSGRE